MITMVRMIMKVARVKVKQAVRHCARGLLLFSRGDDDDYY